MCIYVYTYIYVYVYVYTHILIHNNSCYYYYYYAFVCYVIIRTRGHRVPFVEGPELSAALATDDVIIICVCACVCVCIYIYIYYVYIYIYIYTHIYIYIYIHTYCNLDAIHTLPSLLLYHIVCYELRSAVHADEDVLVETVWWSNNHFDNLRFRIPLETSTCAAGKSCMLCVSF